MQQTKSASKILERWRIDFPIITFEQLQIHLWLNGSQLCQTQQKALINPHWSWEGRPLAKLRAAVCC
eukprot:1843553-Amphidinium_carterae.1